MDVKDACLELLWEKSLEYEGTEFAVVLGDLARQVQEFPTSARKVKKHTPILKGSVITFPAWRCTNCGHEERTSKGFYCRMCGRRFDE